jgi:hypothetical protein
MLITGNLKFCMEIERGAVQLASFLICLDLQEPRPFRDGSSKSLEAAQRRPTLSSPPLARPALRQNLFREGAIMRHLLLAVPAALLLASHAGAQSGNYPPPDTAPISTVQVTAPVRLSEDQIQSLRGYYAMSNGWHMKVERASKGIVARIDQQPPIRLVALTADKFVSRDGNVTMDFNQGDNGDEMVMSYVPDQRLAIRYVVTATLAQR